MIVQCDTITCNLQCNILTCNLQCNTLTCNLQCNILTFNLQFNILTCNLQCNILTCNLLEVDIGMYWVTCLFPFHFQKRFKIAREDINVSSACTYRYKVTDFMELRLIYFLEKSR